MTGRKVTIFCIVTITVLLVLVFLTRKNAYHPRSFEVEGDKFTAKVQNGGELILDLPANAATGFTWVITETPENFASDYNTYVVKNDKLIGSGGTAEFHIIALAEGTGTMVFQYKRNWDGGELAGTYHLTLHISRHGKVQLQIEDVSFEKVE